MIDILPLRSSARPSVVYGSHMGAQLAQARDRGEIRVGISYKA